MKEELEVIEKIVDLVNNEIKKILINQLKKQEEAFINSDEDYFLPFAHNKIDRELQHEMSMIPSYIKSYQDILFSSDIVEYAKRVQDRKIEFDKSKRKCYNIV